MMSIAPNAKDLVESSINRVERWVEDHNYRAYEPFDGLSSWFRPLTFNTVLGQRLLMQLIRQSPINLRPIMGVKPKDSTKGRGYMAHGYLYRYRTTGDKKYLERAEACLDWLDHHKVKKFETHSWANHFDFASRGGTYTSDDPIIVWTALIGLAYLEAYEQTNNERWLQIAESACDWIMDLPREETDCGNCLSYVAYAQSSIHNSNMLGAAMLARTAKHTGNKEYLDVARSGMEYSCTRQLEDGAWWYGEDPKYHWVDNFHTGYNLDCLKTYIDATGDNTWKPNFTIGLKYYKGNFFEADGCPKYYNTRCYPIDSQCAAQSIESLATFSDEDPECLELAVKVAKWTIENMQGADGHFFYRIYPLMKARTPMLHWAQATTYKGLAILLEKLSKTEVAK
ncbi:MAG: glycoside hydrolase family 88 protein [Verrucomicrobiae bacterium]|nr:glycoside hydrolase family 88 protein [Verrucomicrobiae bacterium]